MMTREQFEHETMTLRPRLVAIAEGITGSRDEAEDTVQDVLLKLWGMSGELNPPIEAFACVVTRHAALDRLRLAESMEFNEIARLLHTSEQNVRQILSRARKAVMKKYTGK